MTAFQLALGEDSVVGGEGSVACDHTWFSNPSLGDGVKGGEILSLLRYSTSSGRRGLASSSGESGAERPRGEAKLWLCWPRGAILLSAEWPRGED